jgi:hypothetical protein
MPRGEPRSHGVGFWMTFCQYSHGDPVSQREIVAYSSPREPREILSDGTAPSYEAIRGDSVTRGYGVPRWIAPTNK